ncbi:hypothetical protein [Salinispora oceanensis]|uniref:hypothetical protein n=1 Tax=Salinispora oceanensis TaxID=1050199 RepID=UPI00037A7D6D|nr:hypothetical protein [Salinispora oceanensis]
MGKRNVASGNDRVAVQAGEVRGRKSTQKAAPPIPAEKVESKSVRRGNATVGRQVDEIRGGLTIRF